jgi:NAD(P)H dehydrogenase (quinone)
VKQRHTNTLVVICHPRTDSLIRAAGERVVAGLERAGTPVRVLDLDGLGLGGSNTAPFDPVLSRHEKINHLSDPDDRPDLADHFDALRWAHRIVFVYPTWFSGQPAMLKGWFDRVWANGVVFELPPEATRIRGLLKNVKRLEIVTSHGSSKLVNLVQANSGQRVIFRSLRVLCHPLCRTHLTAIYNIDRAEPAIIEAWLSEVEERFSS